MRHRIPMPNPLHAPLTTAELEFRKTGKIIVPSPLGRLIICSKCGIPGGTLIKVDDHYQHQDTAICKLPAYSVRRHIK